MPDADPELSQRVGYSTASTSDCPVPRKDIPVKVKYPDGDDNTNNVRYTYYANGARRTMTDQRGCVHTYDYDAWGRLTADRVTTTGAGVDATVLCIGRTYEALGRLAAVKSYGSSSTSGNVLNQISYTYGDRWGYRTGAGQSHAGTGGAKPFFGLVVQTLPLPMERW